jgi:hypothetical protein
MMAAKGDSMTTKKNHARAPGKQQRTIAIDKALLAQIAELATADRRTVNSMIGKLLWDAVRQDQKAAGNGETRSTTLLDGEPMGKPSMDARGTKRTSAR